MAATNPSGRETPSGPDADEPLVETGGVGVNHLTVVPTNFDPGVDRS